MISIWWHFRSCLGLFVGSWVISIWSCLVAFKVCLSVVGWFVWSRAFSILTGFSCHMPPGSCRKDNEAIGDHVAGYVNRHFASRPVELCIFIYTYICRYMHAYHHPEVDRLWRM